MDTLIACFSCVVFLSYCVQGMSQNACTALSDGEMHKKTTNLFVIHFLLKIIIADSLMIQMVTRTL